MPRFVLLVQQLLSLLCLLVLGAQRVVPSPEPPSGESDDAIVPTESGPVRGVIHDGVREFRGIPYAKAPVGDLRWERPQPPAPWEGVLDATAYGSGCPQLSRYGLTEAGEDEGCLVLNVTTPAQPSATPRPVIVWIHGGAFVGGSSALYPLAALALAGDAVVVSMNYRLGVFGFMAHPAFDAATSGGIGLEDQRAALRWVQRNIAAFGGDPGNVTIAGESAGGAGVCMHLIAPEETSGLFHKAIVQSAACEQPLRTVAENEALGLRIAALAGCGDAQTALACLRAAPVKTLLKAGAAAAGGDLTAFSPSIGNETVPRQGAEAIRSGNFARVPLLNGGNQREMLLYVAYDLQAGASITTETYDDHLRAAYSENATRVAAEYPLSAYPAAPVALGTALSDFTPTIGLGNCLFLQTGKDASGYVPVYQYEFADPAAPPVTENPGFAMGAVHSAELPYLFPRFSNTTRLDGPDLPPASQRLAEQMLAYWTSFARTGTPSAPDGPEWTPFRSPHAVMRFASDAVGEYDAAAAHHCAFWQELYPDRLSL
ncbi:MAG: carboxylesterase family protein [Thermomicrobiales bacterium]|nr:carboxylesterase family protein [Thermomicrobiales bacterium]